MSYPTYPVENHMVQGPDEFDQPTPPCKHEWECGTTGGAEWVEHDKITFRCFCELCGEEGWIILKIKEIEWDDGQQAVF